MAPVLVSVPRPLTRHVRLRGWMEPYVRFWWVAALVVLAVGVYLVAMQFADWRHGAWLTRKGTLVQATVVEADGDALLIAGLPGTKPRGRQKPPNVAVTLEFMWDGQKHKVDGFLEGRKPGDFVAAGDVVPLRINPANPDDWTARTEPFPLGIATLGGVMAMVVAAAMVLFAWSAQRRVLRIWRDGEALEAMVVSTYQTALAPGSRAARCTLVGGTDRRIFTVYLPSSRTRSTAPLPDESQADDGEEIIWVIRGSKGRLLASSWFA